MLCMCMITRDACEKFGTFEIENLGCACAPEGPRWRILLVSARAPRRYAICGVATES